MDNRYDTKQKELNKKVKNKRLKFRFVVADLMLIKRMGLIYTRYVAIVAAGVVYTWFVLICGCGEDFWALISLSSLKNKAHEFIYQSVTSIIQSEPTINYM